MIQAGQRTKVLLGEGLCVLGDDESIGVSRIANNQHLAIPPSHPIKSLALELEDGGVGLEQVLALHALLTGHGAHQDGNVAVHEGLEGVGGGGDAGEVRAGLVFNLHDDALEDSGHRLNVKQMQIDRLQ